MFLPVYHRELPPLSFYKQRTVSLALFLICKLDENYFYYFYKQRQYLKHSPYEVYVLLKFVLRLEGLDCSEFFHHTDVLRLYE